MNALDELKYDFSGGQNGYFQLGGFLFQWGLSGGGVGGELRRPDEHSPAVGFGLFISWGFSLGKNKSQAWETSVNMNKEFDEIYGAMGIPFQQISSEGSDSRYNLKVMRLGKTSVSFRTMDYHSPFFWIAYGARMRRDEDESNNRVPRITQ